MSRVAIGSDCVVVEERKAQMELVFDEACEIFARRQPSVSDMVRAARMFQECMNAGSV